MSDGDNSGDSTGKNAPQPSQPRGLPPSDPSTTRIPISELRVGDVLPLRAGDQRIESITISGSVAHLTFRHDPRGARAPLEGTIIIRSRT